MDQHLVCIAALALVSGSCCPDHTSRLDTMPAARLPFAPPDVEPSSVWIVADPQLHNVAGAATRSKTALGDRVSSTALRPPSLDLWADVVLASIVDRMRTAAPRAPVFFLGDAANVSCIGELARFLDVMRPLPWLGVLGNHDGYYMGNMAFRPDPVINPAPSTWQGACQHSTPRGGPELAALERRFLEDLDGKGGLTHVEQRTLTKTHAVWMYLGDLATRVGAAPERSPWIGDNWKLLGEHRRQYTLDAALDLDGAPVAVSVRAQIAELTPKEKGHEQSRAWQAMVVQDVTLPDKVHVLLIDTTDYAWTPPTSPWQLRAIYEQRFRDTCRSSNAKLSLPGKCGEVGPDQVALIRELMKTWAPGTRFLVMGHHPWASLRATSAEALAFLLTEPGFMTYVSAHTHQPASTRDYDAVRPWEINVGSMTDWPMEYARLQYWPTDDSAPGTALRLEIDHAETAALCPYESNAQAHAEVRYDDAEAYTSRALDVYDATLATLSHAEWRAQIAAVRRRPLDDQRALLARLIAFDREVLQDSTQLRAIEAACAIWASAVECTKDDCAARTSKRLGGTDHRSFAFRIGVGNFPESAR